MGWHDEGVYAKPYLNRQSCEELRLLFGFTSNVFEGDRSRTYVMNHAAGKILVGPS